MADRVRHLTTASTDDTPYSKNHYSGREQSSLQSELLFNLPQRRKKKAEDMTTKCIGNDKFEFADKYFPEPPASDTPPKPVFLANPFAELKNADTLDEKTLQDKFVRV